MHRSLLAVGLCLGVAVFAGARNASALSETEIKVHVPFAFEVDNQALPAGDYLIEQPFLLDPEQLVIRGTDGSSTSFYLRGVTPFEGFGRAELVFDRYGRQEFLHGLQLPGRKEVLVATARDERVAARELAAAGAYRSPRPARMAGLGQRSASR